jgi:predicted DNA-binding transcriptional regulator YafY
LRATETVGRLLTLLPWLIERPGASVAETAAAFGVSRSIILGDLDTIGYCGLPGLGGGGPRDPTSARRPARVRTTPRPVASRPDALYAGARILWVNGYLPVLI